MIQSMTPTDVDISWEDTVDQSACNAGKDKYEQVTRDPARTVGVDFEQELIASTRLNLTCLTI